MARPYREDRDAPWSIAAREARLLRSEGVKAGEARLMAVALTSGANIWRRAPEPRPILCVWCHKETSTWLDGVAMCVPCQRWSQR